MRDNSIRKFLKRSWRERFLFLEALWQLGVSRFKVLVVPFNRIAPSLGTQGSIASVTLTSSQVLDSKQIGWAIRAASRRTPWDSNCLTQAITAKRMLQRRGISSTLYLGVRKSKDAPADLEAHAWVKCGDHILTGKHQQQEFTIVSHFGDEG